MYFSEKITAAYSWAKTFYNARVENYPGVDYFFRGINESFKSIYFLRPTISTASALLIKQTKAFFYLSAPPLELKKDISKVGQDETKKEITGLPVSQAVTTTTSQSEMKEWMIIPPLNDSTPDSDLMKIIFLESFKLNTSYLAKIVLYYTLVSPFILKILSFIFYFQKNTSEEANANAEDIHNIMDWIAHIYFVRNVIDLFIQNQAFTRHITSIAKKNSPFTLHAAKCKEKKEDCAHLHSCLCAAHLISQADTNSSIHYFPYAKLVSISANLGIYLGSSMHVTTKMLAYQLGTSLSTDKLFSLSNIISQISLLASIIGSILEIVAEGWCIGEFRLSAIGVCTEHRKNHLKDNYFYYLGMGIVSFLANTFLSKILTDRTHLTGIINSNFITIPISAILFQPYIATILKQEITFKKNAEDYPDVFYYHRKITDAIFKKFFNYIILKLNDQAFRNFLAKFEIPFKLLLFLFLKPSLRSLKLLAKKPAINLYFCWEKNIIDAHMYWVRKTQLLPNATTNYIAKTISFMPSWMINENITLLIGWAENYGINKLIKQIEEFLTLVQCEHPTMRANGGRFYSPLLIQDNHSKSPQSPDIIAYPINQKNINPSDRKKISLAPLKNVIEVENKKPFPIITKSVSIKKEKPQYTRESEEEKWVLVNNVTPLRNNSLFSYVSKFTSKHTCLGSQIKNASYKLLSKIS